MLNLEIKKYTDDMQEKWDEFVQYQSCNGTFLQTRNFLNYHGNLKILLLRYIRGKEQ